MKKNYLLEISFWWMVIIAIIAGIVGIAALIYMIWFMFPCHWVFKILITLTCIALITIFSSIDAQPLRGEMKLHSLEGSLEKDKELENKNINITK